jgi:cytochrome c553
VKNPNSENSNPRQIPNRKSQKFVTGHFIVGTWDFFGVWDLGFGASRARPFSLLGAIVLCALAACRRDMANQPKAKPMSESQFFADSTNARPLPPHTIPREIQQQDETFETGLAGGIYVTQLPMQLTPQLLARGHERYDAFCSMCHGRVGDGQGMVVQRGFPAPPSYHINRLRDAPIGHFFDVITNGYGTMASYASQMEPQDRWAVAAYIRALQLSQNAKASELPPDAQSQLERQP